MMVSVAWVCGRMKSEGIRVVRVVVQVRGLVVLVLSSMRRDRAAAVKDLVVLAV